MQQPVSGDWESIRIDTGAVANLSYSSITYTLKGLHYFFAQSGEVSNCLISEFGVNEDFRGGFGMGGWAIRGFTLEEGITVSNCVIANGYNFCPGILIRHSGDLVVRDCVIRNLDNKGINVSHQHEPDWNIDISGCEISESHGGIYLNTNTTRLINVRDCRIIDCNYGILVSGLCSILIENNDIHDHEEYGIRIAYRYEIENQAIIKNNRIFNCEEGIRIGDEGNVRDEDGLFLDIQFNTIAYTQFPLILNRRYPTPIIRNNIFAHNDVRVMYYRNVENHPDQDYNLFWNSGVPFELELPNYYSVWYGDNDIFADPRFTDIDDFHLLENSPAIDRADPEQEVGDEPQPNGQRANLGGYGTTNEGTVSPEEQLGAIPAIYPLEVHLNLTEVNASADTTFFIMNSGDQPVRINSLTISDSVNFLIEGFEEAIELDPYERIDDIHLIFSPTFAGDFAEQITMNTSTEDVTVPVYGISYDREVLTGDISGTLTADNSPYIIINNASVHRNGRLIIEPGVTILFARWSKLECEGDLYVSGEPSDSVKFTAFSNAPYPGIWGGITCKESVELDFTVVEYAGLNVVIDSDPNLDHENISLTNSSFRHADSYSPEIAVWEHNVHIENIVCNNNYGGIRLEQYSGVENLYINHVTSTYNDIGISLTRYRRLGVPLLKNSIIAFNSRGILGSDEMGFLTVQNCLLFDNEMNDEYIGLDCIVDDPQFLMTPHFPFHLSWNSRCIDTGDEDDPPDPDGTRTDIGAIPHRFNDIEPEIERISPQFRECWAPVNRVKSFVVEVFDENEGDVHDFLWTVGDTSFYAHDSVTCVFDEPGVQTVEVIAIDGHYWSNRLQWEVDVLLGTKDEEKPLTADEFRITSVYPNPFNSTTTIKYSLPFASNISLSLYNLSGQSIETLVNHRQQAGLHQVTLNAFNTPSGLYFVRLETAGQTYTQKIMLVK
ncbi:MAG: T9SS type A sorting domain-containing protein, partial [Calditrichaeota bacterium]|nr:T9SS type A sorting domain-containing protein [Calditrichota bacterium]